MRKLFAAALTGSALFAATAASPAVAQPEPPRGPCNQGTMHAHQTVPHETEGNHRAHDAIPHCEHH